MESWKRFSLTQFVLDGLQDAVGVTEHAGRSGADLDVVLSHRLTEEHGVESRYFINPHWSNAQDLCHLQEKSGNAFRTIALNQKNEKQNMLIIENEKFTVTVEKNKYEILLLFYSYLFSNIYYTVYFCAPMANIL